MLGPVAVAMAAAAARSMAVPATVPSAAIATMPAPVASKQATAMSASKAAKQTATVPATPSATVSAAATTHQQINKNPADQHDQYPIVGNPLHRVSLSKHRPIPGASCTTQTCGEL